MKYSGPSASLYLSGADFLRTRRRCPVDRGLQLAGVELRDVPGRPGAPRHDGAGRRRGLGDLLLVQLGHVLVRLPPHARG